MKKGETSSQLRRLGGVTLILALAACGGDGDEAPPPSLQLSGLVTTEVGSPVSNIEIRFTAVKDCFNFFGIVTTYIRSGRGTSNASGQYVATIVMDGATDCPINAPFRVFPAIPALPSCSNGRLPCYVDFPNWFEHAGFSPRGGINFLVRL